MFSREELLYTFSRWLNVIVLNEEEDYTLSFKYDKNKFSLLEFLSRLFQCMSSNEIGRVVCNGLTGTT